ncbi:MAG: GAF domain-containing protein [Planctomycetota bacterium]
MPAPHEPDQIDALCRALEAPAPLDARMQAVLELIVQQWGAVTGTLHSLTDDRTLALRAWYGLPESMLAIVRLIPMGKGMAGVCAQTRAPVTMCNLQSDQSGVARPGARASGAQGAIVVPMLSAGELYGTLGIGMSGPHDFSKDDESRLLEAGRHIACALARTRLGR